ncbi:MULTISPECIES: LysR family transcriptional regulator [Pseudomonas]|uniref:LysR family transcriptional regulator n=1 Tax=Pseudomonas donghuensis TaxID=1163398 RepID=A0AAP0X7W0_9PSED|nr:MULTISPECIES: LysR family transcriptional regulator [Pseudomonas]MDF9894691.1 DNA-binding transcriptional LysR family regulator [Pseudomonas vranovensis]KDN98215.1 LysR family transcriptional regulator [Pseudomonas donghuensis]MBF4211222.1 LysR family transcriptional regulator [Pseudomonas donghuensis]MBS7597152.1 LysR family transcriptional regulator [Pseudomonas sp. RC2C2]MCP6693126.1 LysR family transcriptional regulator [Pseudomonas donghuensis]
MNLKQIEYALAVVDTGSFTRAAERCHVVQSALSHQIARLEETLGVSLFERSSRRVRLTPAGEAFVQSARPALEATRRIAEDVAAACGEVRGQLSIGEITSLTELDLVDLLADFHAQHPLVDIRWLMAKSELLIADVRERRLDVGFIGVWPGERLDGVEYRLLAEEELVAVMAVEHPLAGAARLSLVDLQAQPLVDFPAGSGARRQTDEAFAAAGVRHRVQFEVTNIRLVEKFAKRGLAIGLVPARIANSFNGVMSVAIEDAPVRHVYAIWSMHPTPAARAFAQLIEQRLAVRDGH